MVKSHELRVSNLVLYEGYVWAVNAIDLNKVRLSRLTEEGSVTAVVTDDKLEPIVLDENWLKELGFANEIHEDTDTRFWYHKEGRLNIHEDYWGGKAYGNFGFATATECDHVTHKSGVAVSSVHKLQNIFFDMNNSIITV